MREYSVKATADALDIHPRTLRRWIAAGQVKGAYQVKGKVGPVWRIPADALDALRDRVARDVEPIPPIDPVRCDDHSDATDSDARELAPSDSFAQAVALLDRVQAMSDKAAELATERERKAAGEVADALRQTIADQGNAIETLQRTVTAQEGQINTLQGLVSAAHDSLREERQAHDATRRERNQLRLKLGLRTRPTTPLRIIEGGE